METAKVPTLLQSVITLRDLLDGEQEETDDEIDLVLLRLLDTFIVDQQYQLGEKPSLYSNPLERRTILRQILHAADRVLDRMAELADGEPLSAAARGLCRFLFEITFYAFKIVMSIEAAHPELAEMFALQRAVYNATRET